MLVTNCLNLDSPCSWPHFSRGVLGGLLLQFISTAFSDSYSCVLTPPSLFVTEQLLFLDSTKDFNCSDSVSVSQAFLLTVHGRLGTWRPCCEGQPKNLTRRHAPVPPGPNLQWSHFPEGRVLPYSNPSLFALGHPNGVEDCLCCLSIYSRLSSMQSIGDTGINDSLCPRSYYSA